MCRADIGRGCLNSDLADLQIARIYPAPPQKTGDAGVAPGRGGSMCAVPTRSVGTRNQ